MKKIFTLLLTVFLLMISIVPVFGETTDQIKITRAKATTSGVIVVGKVDETVETAVVVAVTEKGSSDILAMEAIEVIDKSFNATVSTNLDENKEYTIKVANYDGGNWYTFDVRVPVQPTGDAASYSPPKTGIR